MECSLSSGALGKCCSVGPQLNGSLFVQRELRKAPASMGPLIVTPIEHFTKELGDTLEKEREGGMKGEEMPIWMVCSSATWW